MVGTNLLSPLSGVNASNISSNLAFTLFAEFRPVKRFVGIGRFGIGLNARIGVNPSLDIPGGLTGLLPRYSSTQYWNKNAMTHLEIGVIPIFYLNPTGVLSWSFKGGVYFGKNEGVNNFQYQDYYGHQDTACDWCSDYYVQYGLVERNYYRVSFSAGLDINLWKTIGIGFELGGTYGNWQSRENMYYENSKEDATYFEVSGGVYGESIALQGAVNLYFQIGRSLIEERKAPD